MSNIEKAQHDILQVCITQTMIDWAKEQSRISTDRCFAGYDVDNTICVTCWYPIRKGDRRC